MTTRIKPIGKTKKGVPVYSYTQLVRMEVSALQYYTGLAHLSEIYVPKPLVKYCIPAVKKNDTLIKDIPDTIWRALAKIQRPNLQKAMGITHQNKSTAFLQPEAVLAVKALAFEQAANLIKEGA